jgi:hypothetical protein
LPLYRPADLSTNSSSRVGSILVEVLRQKTSASRRSTRGWRADPEAQSWRASSEDGRADHEVQLSPPMWQSQWLRRPCAQPELPNLVAKRKTAPQIVLGHGRQQRPGYPWGTENRRDPKLPGARKTAATRISLGLGRRRPGYPWVTEDGSPGIPGSRKTAARVSLGDGERARSWMGGRAACQAALRSCPLYPVLSRLSWTSLA